MPLYSVSEVGADGHEALVSGFINPAGVIAWLLQLLVFTTPGLIVSVLVITIVTYMQFPDRPWLTIIAPLYLLPLVFLAVIFMVLSMFITHATEWVFSRLWGVPDHTNLTHRVGFFMLSVPIFVFVVVIFGFDDGGGGCLGPARYCS